MRNYHKMQSKSQRRDPQAAPEITFNLRRLSQVSAGHGPLNGPSISAKDSLGCGNNLRMTL